MDNKTYKIAIVGNRDTILPFGMIGIETFPVLDAKQAASLLKELASSGYGIIYLTEDMAAEIPDLISHYDSQLSPAIILLPTHRGSSGLGLQRVQESVEKAVGQNIL